MTNLAEPSHFREAFCDCIAVALRDGAEVPSDTKTAHDYEVLPGRYWLVGYDGSGSPVYKQEMPTEPDLMSQLCG